MRDFLTFFTNFTYVFFIVGCLFYGVSIGVNIYVKSVIKRINKNTNLRFNKIEDDISKNECLASIKDAQSEYIAYLDECKKRKKLINKYKINSLCSKKTKRIDDVENTTKSSDIFINLAKNMANPFSFYENKERGYLSFSEREIFAVLEEFKLRLIDIINSSNIIWLKGIKISFLLECWNLYDGAIQIKNRPFMLFAISIIDFFLWFNKLISPAGMSKFIVSSAMGSSLSSLISLSIIDVIGKELAVIYYEKSKIKEKELKRIPA